MPSYRRCSSAPRTTSSTSRARTAVYRSPAALHSTPRGSAWLLKLRLGGTREFQIEPQRAAPTREAHGNAAGQAHRDSAVGMAGYAARPEAHARVQEPR